MIPEPCNTLKFLYARWSTFSGRFHTVSFTMQSHDQNSTFIFNNSYRYTFNFWHSDENGTLHRYPHFIPRRCSNIVHTFTLEIKIVLSYSYMYTAFIQTRQFFLAVWMGGLVFHRRPRFDEIKTLNDYQVVPELARICLYFLPCQYSWPQGAVKMQTRHTLPHFLFTLHSGLL